MERFAEHLAAPYGRGVLRSGGHDGHAGGSLCTCDAQVLDADGAPLASAMGTFKYWRAPLGGVE